MVPRRSPIPHTLLDPERGISVCIFVKDPQSKFEEVLAAHPVPGFDRVIGYKQLRKEFRDFKKRRELLASHDAFVCDDRILPMLPKLVGKTFFRARQNPVPVRLSKVPVGENATGSVAKERATARALRAALEPARDATWIRFLGQGTTFSVRAAHPYHKPKQVADNVRSVISHTASVVPGGWGNVQAVFLKSTSSEPLQLHAGFGAISRLPKPSASASSSSSSPSSSAATEEEAAEVASSTEDAKAPSKASPGKRRRGSSDEAKGKRNRPAAAKAKTMKQQAAIAAVVSKPAAKPGGGKEAARAVREVLGGKNRSKPGRSKSPARKSGRSQRRK